MGQQRFKLRATIIGSGVWVCPDCGHHQRLHLTPKARWRVHCTNKDCQHIFRVGLVFHRQKQGERDTGHPPDTIIGESIPESELAPEPYKQRDPVHKVGMEVGAEEPKPPGLLEGIAAGFSRG